MKKQSMTATTLYCPVCGKKGIPIMRKTGKQKPSFHRKWLYCIYCNRLTNHVECRSEEDILLFQEMYSDGEFEVDRSLAEGMTG